MDRWSGGARGGDVRLELPLPVLVEQVQARTERRGFARGFRPWVLNLDAGVRGIFGTFRISLSWDYQNALGPLVL